MQSGISIGASTESIEAAKSTILAILDARADQKTLRAALQAFRDVCRVSDVTISDITFTENHGEAATKAQEPDTEAAEERPVDRYYVD